MRVGKVVGRAAAVLFLLVVAYFVLTPTGRYLLRAGWEEGKILARRRPIAELVAASTTPPPLRAKLQQLDSAREVLELSSRRAYETRYRQLKTELSDLFPASPQKNGSHVEWLAEAPSQLA